LIGISIKKMERVCTVDKEVNGIASIIIIDEKQDKVCTILDFGEGHVEIQVEPGYDWSGLEGRCHVFG